MHLISENPNKEKALIIAPKSADLTSFVDALGRYLHKHDMETVLHENITQELTDDFTYVFACVSDLRDAQLKTLLSYHPKTIIITPNSQLYHSLEQALLKLEKLSPLKKSHIKIVNIEDASVSPELLESILWFFISDKHSSNLDLSNSLPLKKAPIKKSRRKISLSKKQKWTFGIVVFLCIQFFFLLPLLGSGFFMYKSARALQNQNLEKAMEHLNTAKPLYEMSQKSYVVSRPVFSLFFVSLFPENLLALEQNVLVSLEKGISIFAHSKELSSSLLNPAKKPSDIEDVEKSITTMQNDLKDFDAALGNLDALSDFPVKKVQNARKQIGDIRTFIQSAQIFLDHSKELIGTSETQKYVVFFYNNMELRPGGGFIGSFAVLEFADYSLLDFKVYDVYDADGQLQGHIEPPDAIREYLNQPNWYLRDSNFSPDFVDNVNNAAYFLDKELGLRDVDGYAAITTTGLTYILEGFGNVYIPDFQETITKDNFYMKAQVQSEGNFFPGSKSKKNYLSTVGRALFLKLESASYLDLGKAIQKALNQKQIVLFSQLPEVQKELDDLHWGGKMSTPECLNPEVPCIINHIMSVDANLGVNKANYYVNTTYNIDSKIHEAGDSSHFYTTTFLNSSPSNIFPGGTYKNFYQIFIPKNAQLTSVKVDGVKTQEAVQSLSGSFKKVAILLEVAPKSKKILTVEYDLPAPDSKKQLTYELVLQKQIGSFNSDVSFALQVPMSYHITATNFPSLAKSSSVVYNTDLSTDQIFIIDLVRD